MNEWLKISLKSTLAIGIAATALGAAHAQLVDFSTVNLTLVQSAAGQNFAAAGGFVNVRLISGAVSALTAGYSPDPNGFYTAQTASNLTPAVFQFTLPTTENFVITQNETLTNLENNKFSLLEEGGGWNVLSYSNATLTPPDGGLIVAFQGTSNSAPYGTYQIGARGPSFDFTVTDSPGIQNYGSAISLNLTGQGAAAAPEPGSIAFGLLAGIGAGVSGLQALRRRRAAIVR